MAPAEKKRFGFPFRFVKHVLTWPDYPPGRWPAPGADADDRPLNSPHFNLGRRLVLWAMMLLRTCAEWAFVGDPRPGEACGADAGDRPALEALGHLIGAAVAR